jgi:hypothetical protein
MQVIVDLIGSSVLIGMIILTIMGVNINMNTETTKSMSEFHTQTEVIQLSRICEFDFYKMGYDYTPASGFHKITIADTSTVKFYANLRNIAGEKDSVQYQLGGLVLWSTNPRDRMLTRWENTTAVLINYSVTRFRLSYYNANDSIMWTPITGNRLDSIKSVRIYLTLESPEPIGTDSSTAYAEGYYEKLLYPRNL